MADPLWEVLAPLAAPWPVIQANQGAPLPAKPYATYQARSLAPLGIMALEPDAQGVSKLAEPLLLRCEVNCYGPGAMDQVRRMALGLRSWASQLRMDALNLGLANLVAMTDASGIVDDPQSQERGVLEFTMNATDVTDDLVGVIEGVTITPDPDVGSGAENVAGLPGHWVTCGGSTSEPPA